MSSSPPCSFPAFHPPLYAYEAPISPISLTGNPDFVTSPQLEPIIEHVEANHQSRDILTRPHRLSSSSSISFKSNGTSEPTGQSRPKPPARVKTSSPPPSPRFKEHVSFDNFAGGEPSEKNTISFTLNVKHKGYQFKKRSRTFMVGIDDNDYSDIALTWMLEELVDDGDEIICVRVVDKDAKLVSDRNLERRQYQKEAKEMLKSIQIRNDENRAISIVLEFAVGKLHTTFQKMIQLYEPAMLVVGTRGRSLGGFQGLVTNRNSFSKWCLQYSPIPVVVVRPTEKRLKKKKKREDDPTRHDYAKILRDSGVEEHETESSTKDNLFEPTNGPDAEASAVADALGLPTTFDTNFKPLIVDGARLRKVESGGAKSDATSNSQESPSPDSRPSSPVSVMKSPKTTMDSPGLSADEYSDDDDDDDEGEFEVVAGHSLLGNGIEGSEIERKKKLHEMEVGEAAALAAGRRQSVGSADSNGSLTGGAPLDEDEDEDDD